MSHGFIFQSIQGTWFFNPGIRSIPMSLFVELYQSDIFAILELDFVNRVVSFFTILLGMQEILKPWKI